MNILLVPHLFYPRIGGVEIAVANLAKQFRLEGHRVGLVTSRLPRSSPEIDFVDGTRVTRLPFRLPSLSAQSILSFLIKGIYSVKKIVTLAKKSKFDLINVHYVSENALYALVLSYVDKLPLITSIHGSDIEDFSMRSRLNRLLVARTLKKSTRIISNSSKLLDRTAELFGEDLKDKAVVVGNGVDLSKFGHLGNPLENLSPFILGVGRLVPVKGFDLLIKAFPLVKDQFPDLNLVLIGDGPERRRLENISYRCGLRKSVIFCGSIEPENVPGYFAGCEFFVLPSRRESFGMVCLEAMSAKKAVIATDVGAISEFLHHGKNGLLVQDRSPRSLAEAIIRLLENPKLTKRFGMHGRRIVERSYTWQKISDIYIETFQSVL